ATRTGKPAACGRPALQLVDGPPGRPLALVLVPTRELAVQVGEACWRYGRELGARVVPLYGGPAAGRPLRAPPRCAGTSRVRSASRSVASSSPCATAPTSSWPRRAGPSTTSSAARSTSRRSG